MNLKFESYCKCNHPPGYISNQPKACGNSSRSSEPCGNSSRSSEPCGSGSSQSETLESSTASSASSLLMTQKVIQHINTEFCKLVEGFCITKFKCNQP